MARKRRIFTVSTPLGYQVLLDRDRWRQIVRYKHPAMANRENEVKACLASPEVIRESAKEADVHLYYKPVGSVYVCAVVARGDATSYFVITAYYTNNIKKGKELWRN